MKPFLNFCNTYKLYAAGMFPGFPATRLNYITWLFSVQIILILFISHQITTTVACQSDKQVLGDSRKEKLEQHPHHRSPNRLLPSAVFSLGQLLVSDQEWALHPFMLEDHGLRIKGANSHYHRFTLYCEPPKCEQNHTVSNSKDEILSPRPTWNESDLWSAMWTKLLQWLHCKQMAHSNRPDIPCSWSTTTPFFQSRFLHNVQRHVNQDRHCK